MELSSSDSEEENVGLEFWNNWKPPPVSELCQIKPDSRQGRRTRTDTCFSSRKPSFIFPEYDCKFGNWIPPKCFLEHSLKRTQSKVLKENPEQTERNRKETEGESSNVRKFKDLSEIRTKSPFSVNGWRKELNPSWGERVQLHDVMKFNDGDLVWGSVNLGIFADIRLWVNEYGIICGSADGKISKLGSSEMTFISIKSTQLLQKMLSLSPAQWATLCETVQETKTVLKFDAFEVTDLSKKTSLEKLWYFICKRRHFLPNQCMLVKLCGAVKCFRQFKITTKLIVQEIRNMEGGANLEMFRLNSAFLNAKQKELLLLEFFLKKFPRNQKVEPFHVNATVNSSQEPVPKSLPCLPVQPLEQMFEKYIKSVKPFVNSSELERTKELIRKFTEDENCKKLQKLLEDRAKSMDNWLADWWLQTAYLEYRNPVIVYSSPALVWPEVEFRNQEEQLSYAAHVIKYALDFNKRLEEKKAPKDKLGGHLLCSDQYNKIFGTCRIPKLPKDELLFQDPQNPSTNIIVIYNNHLFNVPVFKNGERQPFSASHFYSMLLDVVAQGSEKSGIPVGILTTEHRDNWAKSYEELKRDIGNKRILEECVEKALFVVCIDNPLPSDIDPSKCETKTSKLLLHGFGARGNAGNRWFDKTVQFIVGAAGDGVGIAYEHSPAEGGPIAVLTDYIVSLIKPGERLEPASNYPRPEKLEFALTDSIREDISSAGAGVNRLSDDLDVCGWHFRNFGKNELKGLNVSPDSFIQIAIQLAFYKLHSRAGAQYESGSLRKFLYGRTDTIRSCSEEVVRFCEAITNSTATSVGVSKALRQAIDSHKNYAQEVFYGRGVDRHLLGLRILAKLNNMEDLSVCRDAAFQRSTHFQLSTSNVPTKCDAFMVYGPLVHDGYACCYNPRDDCINFGMSAWSSSEATCLDWFKKNLEESLTSMRLCLADSLKTSKL